jgi:hypothetical protein
MRRRPARFLLVVALAEGLALALLVFAWSADLISDGAFPLAAIGIAAVFSPFLAAAALAMLRARQTADPQPLRRSALSSARGSRPSR